LVQRAAAGGGEKHGKEADAAGLHVPTSKVSLTWIDGSVHCCYRQLDSLFWWCFRDWYFSVLVSGSNVQFSL
jgi:hypothetical protein